MNPIIDLLTHEPTFTLGYTVEFPDSGLVSVNKLYTTVQGRRVLSRAGKAVKARIQSAAAEATMLGAAPWPTVLDSVYNEGWRVVLLINLYFARLYNASWKPGGGITKPYKHKDKTTGEVSMRGGGERQLPYQKKDGTNYIKLIEDGSAKGTSIDDSCNLLTAVMKHEGRPRVEIWYGVYP